MSVAIYVFGVLVVVLVMLSSYFLGERSKNRTGMGPYESGIKGFSGPNIRFFTHYFLLAILFVIFDMESVIIYLWASVARELGWISFFQVLFFVAMLLLALWYAFAMNVFSLLKKPRKLGERIS